VATIAALAVLNGMARLGSRFTIIGAAQHVEFDVRNDLYASMQTFSPPTIAARGTGDLMTRASSDVSAVKQLVGFGGLSLVSTTFAYGGAIAAMLAIDPWLTLWAMSPYPVLVLLAKRFNAATHDRAEAQQAQLGVLSGVVQEHIAGMAVVRAYAMERRAGATFSAANDELLRRSLALGRMEAQFSPLMSLIAGIGVLVVGWFLARARTRYPGVLALWALLVGVLVCQAVLGEVQYRNALPWGLVLLHVALAATIWTLTVVIAYVLWRPPRRLARQ
jgi:ATP-binding cassette subfamily B protein